MCASINEISVSEKAKSTTTNYCSNVSVDPDNILGPEMRTKFHELHKHYEDTFNPNVSKYNDASGPIRGKVNMGPILPPQRKGRVPQYNKSKLVELQLKCDELEKQGVLATPEQVNTSVEYLKCTENPIQLRTH